MQHDPLIPDDLNKTMFVKWSFYQGYNFARLEMTVCHKTLLISLC